MSRACAKSLPLWATNVVCPLRLDRIILSRQPLDSSHPSLYAPRQARADLIGVDRLNKALFSKDPLNQASRGHIECRIVHLDAVRDCLPAEAVADLSRIALLDGNLVACRQLAIEGAGRRGHVERNTVRC